MMRGDLTMRDRIEVRVKQLNSSQYQIREARQWVERQLPRTEQIGSDTGSAESKEVPVPDGVIVDVIRQMVREDMAFANAYVNVTPVTKNSPITLTVNVKPQSGYSLRSQRIDERKLLTEWLKSVGHPLQVGDEGYRQQNHWWNTNGQSFRFLDLAVELQTEICSAALGDGHLYPFPSRNKVTLPRGFRYAHVLLGLGHNMQPKKARQWSYYAPLHRNQNTTRVGLEWEVPQPNLSILCLSRHVKIIALQASTWNWKHFIDYDTFKGVITANTLPSFKWLKNI